LEEVETPEVKEAQAATWLAELRRLTALSDGRRWREAALSLDVAEALSSEGGHVGSSSGSSQRLLGGDVLPELRRREARLAGEVEEVGDDLECSLGELTAELDALTEELFVTSASGQRTRVSMRPDGSSGRCSLLPHQLLMRRTRMAAPPGGARVAAAGLLAPKRALVRLAFLSWLRVLSEADLRRPRRGSAAATGGSAAVGVAVARAAPSSLWWAFRAWAAAVATAVARASASAAGGLPSEPLAAVAALLGVEEATHALAQMPVVAVPAGGAAAAALAAAEASKGALADGRRRRGELAAAMRRAELSLEKKDPRLAALVARLGAALLSELDAASTSLLGAYGLLARLAAGEGAPLAPPSPPPPRCALPPSEPVALHLGPMAPRRALAM